MHVYTHACRHVYTHVCTHVCTHCYTHDYAHVYTHVHTYVYTCACLYICLCTCSYTCLQVSSIELDDAVAGEHCCMATLLSTRMSIHMSMHLSIYMPTHAVAGEHCCNVCVGSMLLTGILIVLVGQVRRPLVTAGLMMQHQHQRSRHKCTPRRVSQGCASSEMSAACEPAGCRVLRACVPASCLYPRCSAKQPGETKPHGPKGDQWV